jgi:hypothetical protein
MTLFVGSVREEKVLRKIDRVDPVGGEWGLN